MSRRELSDLLKRLNAITNQGWIKSRRPIKNVGAVGNTLEDLLSVKENNFQLPDFGSWELKAQDKKSGSLLTMFHSEPEPRDLHFVPKVLLPIFGWQHLEAGSKYPITEKRISLTINNKFGERGFRINADQHERKIFIEFDLNMVSNENKYQAWKEQIQQNGITRYLPITPYWTFDKVEETLNQKLHNTIYIQADKKINADSTFSFKYNHFLVLANPSFDKFIDLLNNQRVFGDFDARTGHNHGSKLRIHGNDLKNIYESVRHV